MSKTHHIPIIHLERTCAHMDTHSGVSVYRNVLVVWDEDQDDRVLQIIDDMPEEIRDGLLCVQEREATLIFIWRRGCTPGPGIYREGGELSPDDGDVFNVHDSSMFEGESVVYRSFAP